MIDLDFFREGGRVLPEGCDRRPANRLQVLLRMKTDAMHRRCRKVGLEQFTQIEELERLKLPSEKTAYGYEGSGWPRRKE